jgi:uncharacterized alkaline shock family protein YloU
VAGDPSDEEALRGVPNNPHDPTTTRSRSFVSRRAIVDIVRAATLGSYGVIGFAGGGVAARLGERLGLAPHGIAVHIDDGLAVDLDLVVAHGVPIAEVARQVDSAVRYAIHQALDRDLDRLTIHVDGLRVAGLDVVRGSERHAGNDGATPDDLAASGTDVA